MKSVLQLKADALAVDNNGDCALAWACEGGHIGCVKILLEANADVHHTDSHGSPVLNGLLTVKAQYVDIMQLILDAMADPFGQNVFGRTPLHQAAEHHKDMCVELLLKVRAKPDVMDKSGVQPIWLAKTMVEAQTKANEQEEGKGEKKMTHAQKRTIELIEEAIAAKEAEEDQEDQDDEEHSDEEKEEKKDEENEKRRGGGKKKDENAMNFSDGSSSADEVDAPEDDADAMMAPRPKEKISVYNPQNAIEAAVERAKKKNQEIEEQQQREKLGIAAVAEDPVSPGGKAKKTKKASGKGKSTAKKKKK